MAERDETPQRVIHIGEAEPPKSTTERVFAHMEKVNGGCAFIAMYELYLTTHPDASDTEFEDEFVQHFLKAFVEMAGGYEENGYDSMDAAIQALMADEGEAAGAYVYENTSEETVEIVGRMQDFLGITVERVSVLDKWRTRFDEEELKAAGIEFTEEPEDRLVPPPGRICDIDMKLDGSPPAGHVISAGTRKFQGITIPNSTHRENWEDELNDFQTIDNMEINCIIVYREIPLPTFDIYGNLISE